MTADPLSAYRRVWLADFEFRQPPGEWPEPHCLVAQEWRTGETIRLWRDELAKLDAAPFAVDAGSLFVAYYASAELGCFLSLGWPLPTGILDLYAEFRCLTNGCELPCGNGLLGALAYYGLPSIEAANKDAFQALAQRGEPYTAGERAGLLSYCQSDVRGLGRLLHRLAPEIDLPRALLRGRYMAAAARIERQGIPIDVPTLGRLRGGWRSMREQLVERIDAAYGVYDGTEFRAERFARWLDSHRIPWPRLSSGALALDDDTFRSMARSYPAVAPLRELRHALTALRLESLALGADGRNRCLLSAFGSKTGRNQPSTTAFVFGPSCWLRGLIQPPPGRAIAYVDWEQQEFGIGAALSGDAAMMTAYASGDPYLTLAKQAGAIPTEATKRTHAAKREQFKVCALAVQYGMEARSLGQALGASEAEGRQLLQLHRATYPKFWQWSQSAIDFAQLQGWLFTVFGWQLNTHVGSRLKGPRPPALANFPMQANGAEMLRLACCLATERGIEVCAPVHDALLVEGRADSIAEVVAQTREAMAEASRVVLGGFELRTEAKVVAYPKRYMDPRGALMWRTVTGLLGEWEAEAASMTPLEPAEVHGTYLPRFTTPVQSYIESY